MHKNHSAMPHNRKTALDALRGVAVLLMVQQHLIAWLWKEPWHDTGRLIREHPLTMGVNGLGGLAAPLFIVLSGAGVSLLAAGGRQHVNRLLVARGLTILFLGYLLNLLVPSWFTPASWYVLQMIGAALVGGAFFVKVPSRYVIAAGCGVAAITPLLRSFLDTPPALTNAMMGRAGNAAGVVRLVFVEGHFPVFPWLCAFLFGFVAGRYIGSNRRSRVPILAACCAVAGLILMALPPIKGDGVWAHVFSRASAFNVRMYPVTLSLLLLLTSLSLAALTVASSERADSILGIKNPLVCLGRSSLTILMLHALLFRELAIRFGLFKTLPKESSFIVLACVLMALAALATLWRRADFAYGAEWLVRRVAAVFAHY